MCVGTCVLSVYLVLRRNASLTSGPIQKTLEDVFPGPGSPPKHTVLSVLSSGICPLGSLRKAYRFLRGTPAPFRKGVPGIQHEEGWQAGSMGAACIPA